MIYSQESIIGLSLYEAVMRLTGDRDPKDYYCSIELSPRHRIGVGQKFSHHARSCVPVRQNLPAEADARRKYLQDRGGRESDWPTLVKVIKYDGKIQKKAADECADLLRPLFADLAAGKLQVQCRDMAAPLSTPVPVPPDFWDGPWDLVLKDGDTTLTIKSAAQGKSFGRSGIVDNYRLLKIQSATAEAELQPPSAVVAIPEMSHQAHVPKPMQDQTKVGSTRPPRGPTKDDEPYHVMMENLIREGRASRPWDAAKTLVNIERIVPLDGAQSESVIKRLCNGYKESGRPLTGASLRKNAPVTHK